MTDLESGSSVFLLGEASWWWG